MLSGNLGLRRSQSSMDGLPNSHILRPQPRRPANLSLTPMSSSTSEEASPHEYSPTDTASEPETPNSMDSRYNSRREANGRVQADSRDASTTANSLRPQTNSRSIVNLTSSTLFGIYAPSGYEPNRDEPLTPFGTGAQTPARSTSVDMRSKGTPLFTAQAFKEKADIGRERRKERRKSMQQHHHHWRRASASSRVLNVILRTTILFALGLAYGEAITMLHNSGRVAPVQIHRINRSSGLYLAFWGITGVALGFLLPYLDSARIGSRSKQSHEQDDGNETPSEPEMAIMDEDELVVLGHERRGRLAADWSDIVRSIGAFVGIAFAIRKLSWQSTLQVSLTLALVNPVIWYLIDRTRNGFILAIVVGITGSGALLGINPDWIPAPATASPSGSHTSWIEGRVRLEGGPGSSSELLAGIVSYESIGVATWISSVLFCSCIFFGNVGRRLRYRE